LAEVIVSADDLAFLDRLWADWSPAYDASNDLPHVKDALRKPGNLAAALGYYRSTLGTAEHDPALAAEQAATQQSPPQPTMYLHGRDDGCVGVRLAEAAPGFLPSAESRVEILLWCGHFLHLERPDDVNKLILDFLT
jgi:pimeloyl-ACP methyl ester carboxylesterase